MDFPSGTAEVLIVGSGSPTGQRAVTHQLKMRRSMMSNRVRERRAAAAARSRAAAMGRTRRLRRFGAACGGLRSWAIISSLPAPSEGGRERAFSVPETSKSLGAFCMIPPREKKLGDFLGAGGGHRRLLLSAGDPTLLPWGRTTREMACSMFPVAAHPRGGWAGPVRLIRHVSSSCDHAPRGFADTRPSRNACHRTPCPAGVPGDRCAGKRPGRLRGSVRSWKGRNRPSAW